MCKSNVIDRHHHALTCSELCSKRLRSARKLLNRAKHRAKEKGREFDVLVTDVDWPELCPILNIKLKYRFENLEELGHKDQSASIDRVDSEKGYVKGNVMIISLLANRMKNSASIEQLIKFGEWTKTLERD